MTLCHFLFVIEGLGQYTHKHMKIWQLCAAYFHSFRKTYLFLLIITILDFIMCSRSQWNSLLSLQLRDLITCVIATKISYIPGTCKNDCDIKIIVTCVWACACTCAHIHICESIFAHTNASALMRTENLVVMSAWAND